jgi:nicotinamidase-related amidase/alkylated DNA repair dioxygenase AlkB
MAPTRAALLLLDLQNDFLVEGSVFLRRHVEASALSDAVRWAAQLARQQRCGLVWVESVHGEPEATDADAASPPGQPRPGTPACARDSWGAQPVEALRQLAEEASAGQPDWLRLRKRYDSAFRDTGLEAWLRAGGFARIVLAGVATNGCVAATAKDARGLGFEVTILSDATAAASLPRHQNALAELQRAGCAVQRWAEPWLEADGAGPAARIEGIGTGTGAGSVLHLHPLPSIDADTLAALTAEVAWQIMSHRGGEVPRLVATQGDVALAGSEAGVQPLYRHPADDYPPVLPWTPLVRRLREEAAALIGHPFNHCLLQLYRDGRDWIGAHSDKTLDIVPGSFIINVSVGALRTMTLRRKESVTTAAAEAESAARPSRATQRIPLPHGSVLQMSLETNRDWLHEIRQQGAAGELGPRISLTFRHIGTLWDPETTAVWGSGSPHADRVSAERAAATRASWSDEERRRWELDEAARMLRLFREENVTADFRHAQYQPGFELVHLRSFQEHTALRPSAADKA